MERGAVTFNDGRVEFTNYLHFDASCCDIIKTQNEKTQNNVSCIIFDECHNFDYDYLVTVLQTLSLKKVCFTNCIVDYFRVLGDLKTLKHLSVTEEHLVQEAYDSLCKAIENCHSLRSLEISLLIVPNISNCPHRLLDAIQHSKIKSVTFDNCDMIIEYPKETITMIRNSPNIKRICIVDNYEMEMTEEDCLFFCENLKHCDSLETFDLTGNRAFKSQTTKILASLAMLKNLKCVMFDMGKIKRDLLPSLNLLFSHIKFASLKCKLNQEDIALELCSLIANNTKLRCLNLYMKCEGVFMNAFEKIKQIFDQNFTITNGAVTWQNPRTRPQIYHFEGNLEILTKCAESCEMLMCIKKFRQSRDLQVIGHDITLLLANYLFQTRADKEIWKSVPSHQEKKTKFE